MDFLDLARSRYSVRSFSDKKIEREALDYILEAGRCAPTAKNLQPQMIYVVEDEATLAAIHDNVYRPFGAKTVLVCCAKKSEAWVNPHSNWTRAEMDVSICVTQMMLAAASRGVGSTWVCYFDPKKLREVLALPEDVTPMCLLPLGYADGSDASKPSIRHEDRRPLDETVKYI